MHRQKESLLPQMEGNWNASPVSLTGIASPLWWRTSTRPRGSSELSTADDGQGAAEQWYNLSDPQMEEALSDRDIVSSLRGSGTFLTTR